MLNIEDLRKIGQKEHVCPYFFGRSFAGNAQIVICNYPYILDSKVNHIILRDLPENSLLIVDEAHNIDNICIESKTVRIDKFLVDLAKKNLESLKLAYQSQKEKNFELFKKEYMKLVNKYG